MKAKYDVSTAQSAFGEASQLFDKRNEWNKKMNSNINPATPLAFEEQKP